MTRESPPYNVDVGGNPPEQAVYTYKSGVFPLFTEHKN